MSRPAIVWFRRDLRLRDLPALLSAAATAPRGVALFVLDDALLRPAGPRRRSYLMRCLHALDDDLSGRLVVVRGDPADAVPAVAREFDASEVHVSEDFGPYGRQRDARVAEALGDVPLVASGSPYAVSPGRIVKADGTPYKVFSAYRRAWFDHGTRPPAHTGAETVEWLDSAGVKSRVPIPEPEDVTLPPAGERAALARWREFVADGLGRYATDRDRPALDGTSRLSAHLKFGCIHPRTLLHDLRDHRGDGAATFRSELAWRDFYADVLHHRPDTARKNYNRTFDAIEYDTGPDADALFTAWCEGRTGFPIVDAGMRQLLEEGFVPNRVRMIVASFLTKDLHIPWWRGARHFMRYLADGDLASNQHNWQWTAGSGTDAAPYFRIFNPTTQGEKFDPKGDYVRRWVPELRSVVGRRVHTLPDGPPTGYPAPVVDHAHERRTALERYGRIRTTNRPIRRSGGSE
ncbi:cryptochrome/photolyase family protein [Rhodococcus coprophilus]|uniref:Deoxyribodipyrimidine photo-lyase n=1 Tax=Rhodococcus coprophilus TaxID=38310 RepID=A0A2X4UD32_9NOCA|nr:deoxyribodipyrimidine photo-lyase [Rhodococcus coprophilus]MBM7458746.1 deoxyribodipyrimidine photo-lyase [Rhodococcus coprophilus]SQI33338.1 deoxyribodipyrimidine photo-lyase [Rhodococcus coprophilus]